MGRRLLLAAATASAAALTPVALAAAPAGASTQASYHPQRVCQLVNPQHVHEKTCFSYRMVDQNGRGYTPNAKGGPTYYWAPEQRSAYKLPALTTSTPGTGVPVIAIVDAFHYANAYNDLATYRADSRVGLPSLPACTSKAQLTSTPCFYQEDQDGNQAWTGYGVDYGWQGEEALDLDQASVACPKCSLLLVESFDNDAITDTSDPNYQSMEKAENQAASETGVVAVSNSFGGSEDASSASAYNHTGIAILASSGDNGYAAGPQSPADFGTVVAVGGTSLTRASSTARGFTESVWRSAGSGCSAIVAKESWQPSVSGCNGRIIADVSADADPNTGVTVYAPNSQGVSGWAVYGGTSASSPFVAGVIAMAGHHTSYNSSTTSPGARWLYPFNSSTRFDVTSGTNGSCRTLICSGKVGYDGPSGLGTPNGLAGF